LTWAGRTGLPGSPICRDRTETPTAPSKAYRFETSADGANWTTNIVSGTFANIRNNPSLQEVSFAPVNARFFRFTALQEINRNGWTSAAEISVLPVRKQWWS
jgi:hypothetical protein